LSLVAVRIVRGTVAAIRDAIVVTVAIAAIRPAIMGAIGRAATIVVRRCTAIGDRNLVSNTTRQETAGGGDQH
jgi:hypothetical protein